MRATESIIKAIRKAFAAADDPRELSVTSTIRRQELLLARVRAEAAALDASRRRLDDRAAELESESVHLGSEARRLVSVGLEQQAREALRRRALGAHRLRELRAEAAQVALMRDHIGGLENKLAARVDAMRSAHDVASAQVSTAEAHARVTSALEAGSGEVADLSAAFAAAARTAESTRSRADGLDLLISAESHASGDEDAQVEEELKALRNSPPRS